MIVQHNMAAANANRQLGKNVKVNQTFSEKLASGYRVNRAADDASGLAISEEMRAQIRGLNKGSTNSAEGISLLQTADAALVEVHSILDRIKELTVQSANDVNTADDRKAIQHEVDCLLDEIDRIGNDTEYNTMRIFTGSDQGLIGPNGDRVDHIQFEDINLRDFSLWDMPFKDGDPASQLFLEAKLEEGYTTADGAAVRLDWPIVYESGITSVPNFRVTYENDDGTMVTKESAFCTNSVSNRTDMTVDGFSFDLDASPGPTCSRVFHYSPADGVSFDITQTIAVVTPRDADYKYYDMSYTVENTGKKGTIDFMFHVDTAYGGSGGSEGDTIEEYYVNGSKVENSCVYSTYHPQDTHVHDRTGMTNFSIFSLNRDNRNQAPFSESVRWDNSAGPDTVSIGYYNDIWKWNYYDRLNNTLGAPTMTSPDSTADLGYSLIWNDKALDHGAKQTFSFQYGIAALETDTNIPPELIPSRGEVIHTETLNLWIQSGANTFEGTYITIGEMNTNVLRIRPLDVSTQPGAGVSNDKTDQAIEKISLQRARIGAYHNSLEHAQSVDDITSENLQAAESLIRDLDMAEGMVEYAKTNILMQAGQAMLAQANQATQGVVQLLR